MSDQPKPVKALPSSSVLVIRDRAGRLEVLMQERPHTMKFAAGAYVFPGGKVEKSDLDAKLWGEIIDGDVSHDEAFKIAVIRELYEEAELLLGNNDMSEAKRHAPAAEIARVFKREGLRVDLNSLIPFAHWVTPEIIPRRYDTMFYLTEAPSGQEVGRDGSESMKSMWVNPHEIIEAWQEDHVPLMFPTRLNLMKLARSFSVSEALEAAANTPIYRVMPALKSVSGVRKLTIPEEAGYGVTEVSHREMKLDIKAKPKKS